MDAVQFGRWLGRRRRARGWASQRALAAAALSHPRTSGLAISEAFLARVEAGLLVHPFRGAVRRRMVGLAWLLCSSARQVHDYLKVAELSSLDRAETAEIESLVRSLADARTPQLVVLPSPPAYVVGRDGELSTLLDTLMQMRGGCSFVTGMPGIGKTCLALAAAHQLATGDQGTARFPDGIMFVTCAGRHGQDGARTILEDVLALQQPHDRAAAQGATNGDFARLVDRVRGALAGRRLLVLLDGIEADVALDHVLDALQPHGLSVTPPYLVPSDVLAAPVLLITSRYLPPASARAQHLHLPPLAPEAGLRLIEHLLGRALERDERKAALRLCAATGGVPLALEAAVTTLAQTAIPFALLARAAERDPLAALNSVGAPANTITQSLDALAPETRSHLAMLSLLQTESFGLGAATALQPEEPGAALTMTADLVRQSLLEPERPTAGAAATLAGDAGTVHDARFRIPALLRAYAAEQARALPPTVIAAARRNLVAYADSVIERCAGDMRALEAESPTLRAALGYAVRDGEHEHTMRLVRGLLPVAFQRDTCAEIERLLLDGIHAGRASANRHALLSFQNSLGVMRFYQGDYARAHRAWTQCLQLAGDVRAPCALRGVAYLNLAQLADLEGEPDAGWHLAELGLHYSRKAETPWAVAEALVIQAERARRRGDHHVADTYVRESLDLAASTECDHAESFQHVYRIEAHLEKARIARDYAAARTYADQYLALTDTKYRFFLAEALIEQAEYALESDANQDARRLAGRALVIASDARAVALSQHAQAVRQRANLRTARWYGGAAGA
jgi:hypothetical protein